MAPGLEADEAGPETPYRRSVSSRALETGVALRRAAERHQAALLRLALFEAYVDPEWEDFECYTAEQRERVESCADVLLRLQPDLPEGIQAAKYQLRLARIYFDVRRPWKAVPLARAGLKDIGTGEDSVTELRRLGWSCLHTRQALEIAEACYRRAVDVLRGSGREYLDPLDCLQRVLTAAGHLTEADAVSREVRLLRERWEAGRRQRFLDRLTDLRARWETQNREW